MCSPILIPRRELSIERQVHGRAACTNKFAQPQRRHRVLVEVTHLIATGGSHRAKARLEMMDKEERWVLRFRIQFRWVDGSRCSEHRTKIVLFCQCHRHSSPSDVIAKEGKVRVAFACCEARSS